MQALNWNDLRYVLAVSRGGTLAAAARLMAVDDTTVARRLAVLAEAMGTRLYQRLADGTLQLTGAGEAAALRAERIERELGDREAAPPAAAAALSGTVRLTSVPIVVSHLLVPATPALLKRHPGLRLESREGGSPRNRAMDARFRGHDGMGVVPSDEHTRYATSRPSASARRTRSASSLWP
jgi:DNA-binding transcriptional LysR family regulator